MLLSAAVSAQMQRHALSGELSWSTHHACLAWTSMQRRCPQGQLAKQFQSQQCTALRDPGQQTGPFNKTTASGDLSCGLRHVRCSTAVCTLQLQSLLPASYGSDMVLQVALPKTPPQVW